MAGGNDVTGRLGQQLHVFGSKIQQNVKNLRENVNPRLRAAEVRDPESVSEWSGVRPGGPGFQCQAVDVMCVG